MWRILILLGVLFTPIMTSQAIEVNAYVAPHEGELVGYTHEMIRDIIRIHAKHYDVDPDLMIRIAEAESELNYNAIGKVNPRDAGLFQLNDYYTGVDNESAKDPWIASAWTARAISRGELWRWNASRIKWDR